MSGFNPLQKNEFRGCFGPSFLICCQLHSEKTRFLGTSAKNFILQSIFQGFWVAQNAPQIDRKSILEVILGQEGSILVQDGSREISSSTNMAPRTDFDRFSIDVSLIWGWILQALETKLRIPDRRHRPQGLYNMVPSGPPQEDKSLLLGLAQLS